VKICVCGKFPVVPNIIYTSWLKRKQEITASENCYITRNIPDNKKKPARRESYLKKEDIYIYIYIYTLFVLASYDLVTN